MPSLTLPCPYCAEEHEDSFEVLDADKVDQIRCDACEKHFWFAIMECHRCANEQGYSWMHKPAEEAVDHLICDACGSTFRYQDDPSDEESYL